MKMIAPRLIRLINAEVYQPPIIGIIIQWQQMWLIFVQWKFVNFSVPNVNMATSDYKNSIGKFQYIPDQ